MRSIQLTIEGMHCGHCVMAVRKELSKLSGVNVEDVQIGSARLQVDDTKVTADQLAKTVEEAGYRLVAVK